MKRSVYWSFLTLVLLLAPPIVGAGSNLRAGFVVPTSSVETAACEESNQPSNDSAHADQLLARPAAISEPTSQPANQLGHEALASALPNHPGQEPAGGHTNSPMPQDQGPLPAKDNSPSDSGSGQGTGGTGAGFGFGSATQFAGLPATPVVAGSELAMRLFAREASLRMEDLAWRFFRPPRAACVSRMSLSQEATQNYLCAC